jgi:hypothetical protein
MNKKKYIYGYSFDKDGKKKGYKEYLSHSAMELWRKDKLAYRRRYYDGEPSFTSPFTVFGSEVHKLVEDGKLLIDKHLPNEYHHEVKLEASIDGVHVLGYLDMLHKDTLSVTDIKTSINPWTSLMVYKLDQLPLYQLLIKENYNKKDRTARVAWLETCWVTDEVHTQDVKGFTLEVQRPTQHLELTGVQKVIPRKIDGWELTAMREKIVDVAEQIHKDFTSNNK